MKQRAMQSLQMATLASILAFPGWAAPASAPHPTPQPSSPPNVISTGLKIDLPRVLMPERPTVFAFYKSSSTMERDFVTVLREGTQNQIGFHIIQLKTGNEPVAEQFQIKETPTALVYDRRGRLVGRSSQAEEISALVGRALQVMRIDWAQEGDPRLDTVRQMVGGRKQVPGILRTMSLRPDYLQGFVAMSMPAQFTDGFLDRRTKELIGTYVSATNECKYCLGSHAMGLQMQGMEPQSVDFIAALKINQAKLSVKEVALLEYVKLLTLEPSKVRDTHTARLRKVGWSDEQIFEASFITSLFAFANRMANAYGLDYPGGGWFPPALRIANPTMNPTMPQNSKPTPEATKTEPE